MSAGYWFDLDCGRYEDDGQKMELQEALAALTAEGLIVWRRESDERVVGTLSWQIGEPISIVIERRVRGEKKRDQRGSSFSHAEEYTMRIGAMHVVYDAHEISTLIRAVREQSATIIDEIIAASSRAEAIREAREQEREGSKTS